VEQTPIRCGCGKVHPDPSVLAKVGWQADGHGGAALLVNCECRSTLVAQRMDDACLCATCRRLVTGGGDVKVCVWDEQEGPLVLCAACFRRDARRDRWLSWDDVLVRGTQARAGIVDKRTAKAGGGRK
jgi:hypothetical protein